MPYGYVAETTHGDIAFATPVHHEDHPDGTQGWWNDHAHHAYRAMREALNVTQQVLDSAVKIIAIHEFVQGQRGKKVADMN
jgi:hypothetical protein